MLELWNKLHFEERKKEDFIPCLKYSVPIFVEQIYKMQLMKQTAFSRGKNGEYIPCLKYSVPIFVE